MARRTKVVCTIGPASCSREGIRALIESGMNIARLNFSHGDHAEHGERCALVREVAEELGVSVAVMMDLQGPKIRTGDLVDGVHIPLVAGNQIILTSEPVLGTPEKISVSYQQLPYDVKVGDRILLADGTLELRAESVSPPEVHCEIIRGGILGEHKGINLPGVVIQEPSLTAKDREDLAFGLTLGVDYVALSFVRSPDDVRELKALIAASGVYTGVIAKIERPEALERFEEIVALCDGIMVARGDLGVEVPFEEVPIIQKRLIHICNEFGVPVITATQMLESMVTIARATRAEVTDVANAIFDGTDAVMLSAETASGDYPREACRVMAAIAETTDREMASKPPAERWIRLRTSDLRDKSRKRIGAGHLDSYADAIGQAAARMADALAIKRIVCFTKSGYTAAAIARYRPLAPITVITYSEATRRHCALLWGVTAITTEPVDRLDEMMERVETLLLETGMAELGDKVIIVAGAPITVSRRTNLLQLHTLGDLPLTPQEIG